VHRIAVRTRWSILALGLGLLGACDDAAGRLAPPRAVQPAGTDPAASWTVSARRRGGATTGATARAPAPGTACTRRGPTGMLSRTTTDGTGRTRSYELLVPTRHRAGAPLAVTFVFHGAGGTSADARRWGLQDAPGARAASIFVFPQGVEFQGNGVGWEDTCGGYDVVFFDHMLADIQADFCVDPRRVYVAGFSWGCDFVTALLCCRGDVIRGAAAASCSDEFRDPADHDTYANLPCPRRSEAGIRFTHDARGDGAYTALQFASTSALQRALNGCGVTASSAGPGPCVAWSGCRQPVVECTYAGLGHALPATWPADSWRFLSRLR
jgi:polyhydroxybutyrate depolymerase